MSTERTNEPDQTDMNREPVTKPPQGGSDDSYDQLPKEELSEAIEHQSADGRPTHPELSPSRTIWLVLGFFVAILIVALIVGILVHWALGLTMAFLGGVFTLVHPAVWASVQRAREREAAKERVESLHARNGRPEGRKG